MTRSTEIQRVIREGKRIRTGHLDVRVVASPLAHPRVAIVVPRHHQSAVNRNRLKRRLRELVRTELLPTLRRRPSIDVAIRARADTYTLAFESLRGDIWSIRAALAGSDRDE